MLKTYLSNFLKKSEKILHLDTLYFAKTSIYSGIQQAVGIICGLIISYFFGHFASKKLFGDYNLILSVLGFLTIITLTFGKHEVIVDYSKIYDYRNLKLLFKKFKILKMEFYKGLNREYWLPVEIKN